MEHPNTRGKQRTSRAQQTLFQTPGSSRAVWDSGTTEIFLELVRNEKLISNFGGQKTPNGTGYKNVAQHLLAIIGNEYSQKQIKNKFEYFRTDYKCWENLMKNETGIGWNSISGTIDPDHAWWNLKIAQDKNAAKFRDKGLEHKGLLDEIFGDLLATGEYRYTPSATKFWRILR